MGFEHLRILVSTSGPGTNPPPIPRDDCSLESQILGPEASMVYL